jgi:hypothetical protein
MTINHELIALLKRRCEQARKAYGSALYELYGWVRLQEDCWCGEVRSECNECGKVSIEDMQKNPECYDGAECGEMPVDDLIIAYLLMLQAERDERAGHAVEGRTLNKLIAAFEEWKEKDWQENEEGGEP